MYFRVHNRRVCFQGYATCSCEMGGVWDEVNTMGCLSITGQQLLAQVRERVEVTNKNQLRD